MGFYALVARLMPRRLRPRPQFAAAPFAPLHLERRRVLDAAAPGLMLEALPDFQPYVQVGEYQATVQESPELSDEVAQINGFPQATIRLREREVFEDQSVLAVIEIRDSSPMAHQVAIDWGDGSPLQVIDARPQQGDVLALHKFLDDNPTGADSYTIQARVTNTLGEEVNVSTNIQVKNLAPQLDSLSTNSPVSENDTATVSGTYSDPGTLDTHMLDIDWDGDGTFDQSVSVSGGSFSVARQIPDDPAGAADDNFNVNVRLRDDDGGEATGSVPLTVNNAAPAFHFVFITTPLAEGGTAALFGTYTDVGVNDTHTLEIDWDNDGTFDQIENVSDGRFFVNHQFLDDDPSGTASDIFKINLRLQDDDGGEALADVSLTVENVDPEIATLALTPLISENGVATLTGTYQDVGALDTHEIDIDWDGDLIFDQTLAVTGGAFTVTRQYFDDEPSGTPSDTFEVTVRLRDDDGGIDTNSATLTVQNVNPVVTLFTPATIDEDEIATLDGSISDVGTLDTFTLAVDWGDPASPDNVQTFSLGNLPLTKAADGIDWDPSSRTFSIDHQYLDDNPSGGSVNFYTIRVGVTDDDFGTHNAMTSIAVRNLDLSLQVTDDQTVSEGSQLDLTGGKLGEFVDEGTLDTHTATVDWGDGNGTQSVLVDELNGSGTLSASYTYADNGTYTVIVTVIDDDGGSVSRTFTVTVLNVDPMLTGVDLPIPVNEGQIFTLVGLGVGLADPGFDNLLGGTQETLTAISVDWGDGTSEQPLSIATEVDGEAGNPTTATFSHPDHAYADDGTYTVTVKVRDDDGSEILRTFSIVVNNVAPTLSLTTRTLEINEGDTLNLFDLGTFTDPGFNTESFHYSINWGDGTLTQNNQASASVSNGQQGIPTSGTLDDSHQYLDNDADNRYTISVTVFDDDGGSSVEQKIEVVVLNVDPTFVDIDPGTTKVIVATDVNTKGETVLTVQFYDPGTEKFFVPSGADPFQVLIDWGDQLSEPNPDDRFVIEDRLIENPTGPLTYLHKYSGPPNPNNPSADITIRVKIRDDDFYTMTPLGAAGETVVVADVTISQPGIGAEEPFRIDTTPQVPALTFPVRAEVQFVQDNSPTAFNLQQNVVISSGSGETRATTDRYVELRVIDAEGREGPGHRLGPEVLENLPELFRSLPDNHYALYIVNTETNMRRLVIEVYVRNGKLIDPGDDSEGTRDRPPTEEQAIDPPGQEPLQESVEEIPAADQGASLDRQLPGEAGRRPWSRWTAVAMALAASSSAKDWAYKVDETLAKATAKEWRKLGGYNPPNPKKP